MAGWSVTFTVIRDGLPPQEVRFSKSPVTIGSSPSADVVLSDPHVSSRHASVTVSQGQLVFRDTSANGSYRDGVRIMEARLGQAGIVSIPPYLIHVCFELTQAGDGTILRPEGFASGVSPQLAAVPNIGPQRSVPKVAIAPAPPLEDTAHLVVAPSLTITQGPPGLEGCEFSLVNRKRLTLGRSPDCDVALDVPSVSRRHAAVSQHQTDGWTIADLESSNGTMLNGKIVKSASLADGDLISVGRIVLRFTGPPITVEQIRRSTTGTPEDTPSSTGAIDDDSVVETLRIRKDRASSNARVVVLRVVGRVDGYSYPKLRDALSSATDSSDGLIAVDLSACSYCDHTGMGVLLSTQTALVSRGGQLRLFGANAKFRDSLLLLRLESILKLSIGEEAAVEELQAAATGRKADRHPGGTRP